MSKVNVKTILLSLFFSISRIINLGFKSVLNRFISLFLIGGSLCLFFSQNIKTDLIGVFLIAVILSFSVIRVSDNFILSLFTGHLSMSLLAPQEYRKYGYFKNREDISEMLIKDFIIGIKNASKYRKTLRFNTHSWFFNNVVLTDDIITLFEIDAKKVGETRITFEVLCLLSLKEAFENVENTLQISSKKRMGYSVVLKKIM